MRVTPLGFLPSDWDVVKLGDAASYYHNSINPLDFGDEEFEYYSIPAYAESGKPWIEFGSAILSQKLLINSGTVLFGKLNPRVPKIWLVDSDSPRRKIASTEFIPLKERAGISDIHFINFLAWSEYLLPQSQKLVSGSTPSRQRVEVRAFLDLTIPLPPPSEQQAIAHVLTTVRQSIEATERVIAATRELKRSLMNHLFTYGPVPINQVDQIELEENNLGNYPRVWKLTKLEEIAHINEYSRDPREDPDSTFAYIDISSVDSSIGQITSPTYLKGREAPSRARRVIHTGDIILSTVRPYLKAFSIVPNEFDNQICSTGFAVLTPKESCCSEFLFYAALSDIVSKQFVQRMKGANYPAINSGDVKETVIPLPPLDQQIVIAKHLGAIDKKIKKEILRKKALASLFESLLHYLLTGKVRVSSVEM